MKKKLKKEKLKGGDKNSLKDEEFKLKKEKPMLSIDEQIQTDIVSLMKLVEKIILAITVVGITINN